MVLIKDMKMPKDCILCRFNDCGACEAVSGEYKQIVLRRKEEHFPSWCPLTEVEPYGPDGILYKEK